MPLKNIEECFEDIYRDMEGYSISNAGRETLDSEVAQTLIYGETPLSELAKILTNEALKSRLRTSKVFCDLGSGTGKVVIGAAMLLPQLEKIVGIELVGTLHSASNLARERLRTYDRGLAEKIDFVNDSFFNVDFSSRFPADIVFMQYPINGNENLYKKLENKLEKELKPGTIIICCIRKIENTEVFPKIAVSKIKCSFGGETIYYHIKK
jgi:SAM-dependent methyltransferase